MCGVTVMVDENKERAKELAKRYIGGCYCTVMKHYEMTSQRFGSHKGYEFYSSINKYIALWTG